MQKRIREGATNATLADEFDTTEASIRRFRKRHQINPDGVQRDYTKVAGDEAEGSHTSPGVVLDDPDKLLRKRGLNPEDWEITSLTVNDYQGPASAEWAQKTGETSLTYYQTKFTCVKKKPDVQLVAATREGGWSRASARARGIANRAIGGEAVLHVVTGDQQAPFHDPVLHSAFCDWLDYYKPEKGVLLGDTIDFPDVSRHRLDPENTATVNECIQSGANMLFDYVESSPDTSWQLIEGNHDERLRNLILDKPSTRPIYGVKQADLPGTEGADVLAVKHLLQLDALGIEYVSAGGKYDLTEVKLSNKFAVRHGWVVRKGSGASALETLNHLGYSVAVGHTHRQSMVYKTTHDIDRSVQTLVGVETGCMCRVSQAPGEDGRIWPNYAVAPDWQQGFATVTVWPDGKFKVDLATFVNGTLLYRDKRF